MTRRAALRTLGLFLVLLLANGSLVLALSDCSKESSSTHSGEQQGSRAFHHRFGSKTAYTDRPRTRAPEEAPAACNATGVFMVIRHGTRWPTTKQLNKFDKLLKRLSVHADDHASLAFLRAAVLNATRTVFHRRDEGLLAPTGVKELSELGKRIKKMYPTLFQNKPYHPKLHDILSSAKHRALQSAQAFAEGAFGSGKGVVIRSETMDRDILLRFHDNCPNYSKWKKDPQNHYSWKPAFDDALTGAAKTVSRDLGLDDSAALSGDTVESLWNMCRFLVANSLNMERSPCEVFNAEVARELERALDLKDYWLKGPGHRLNHDMACALVDELLAFVSTHGSTNPKSELEDPDVHDARFLFGHAETIVPLVSRLGFYRRAEPWRSGVVAPFAANLAVVVCSQPGEEPSVRMMHNEEPLDMSHLCGASDFCSVNDFVRGVRSLNSRDAATCDFHRTCVEDLQ